MYQKITIIGNLGRDPEMRYMGDGTAVTNFNVATNRRWSNQAGEPVSETTWFRVSVWGRQAETANQYLSKGSRVLVEGRLQPDPATGGPRMYSRQDGSMGSNFEIRATDVRFLSGRDEASGGGGFDGGSASSGSGGGSMAQEEDDIPF